MDLAISLATQIGALFIMIGVGYVLIKADICTISESKLFLNCKMKLELRNWDKGACPFIPIRAVASPYSQFSYKKSP